MNYGAIGGGIIFLYKLILTFTGLTFSLAASFSGIILVILIIYGTKNLRDKHYNGNINYGKALYSGILISVFAGIIVGFYIYLEYSFIKPENMDKILKYQEETFKAMEPSMIQLKLW